MKKSIKTALARREKKCLTAALGIALMGWTCQAHATDFYFPLGFGSAGKPNSFAFETWDAYSSIGNAPVTNRFSTALEIAYFTPSGFTGTTRDQFELYAFFWGGHQDTHGDPAQANGWGAAIPDVGIEYYYQVIQPNPAEKDPNSPNYFTYWTSPDFTLYFPNGNDYPAGYGAGDNEFSININWQNYARWGRFASTFVPVSATYAFNQLAQQITATPGIFAPPARFGWSIDTAIVNLQYHVTDNLWLGVYHQYNINQVSGTAPFIPQTEEGQIGPTFEYDGFGKSNLYIQGAILTDYYHSPGTARNNVSALFYLFQYLN